MHIYNIVNCNDIMLLFHIIIQVLQVVKLASLAQLFACSGGGIYKDCVHRTYILLVAKLLVFCNFNV